MTSTHQVLDYQRLGTDAHTHTHTHTHTYTHTLASTYQEGKSQIRQADRGDDWPCTPWCLPSLSHTDPDFTTSIHSRCPSNTAQIMPKFTSWTYFIIRLLVEHKNNQPAKCCLMTLDSQGSMSTKIFSCTSRIFLEVIGIPADISLCLIQMRYGPGININSFRNFLGIFPKFIFGQKLANFDWDLLTWNQIYLSWLVLS